MQRTAPQRFTFITLSISSVVTSSMTALPPTPALLTSTSTRPACSSTFAMPSRDRVVVGDVELDQLHLGAGVRRHGAELVGPPDVANCAVDVVAIRGEVDGCRSPNPRVGTSDNADSRHGRGG